MGAFSSLMTIVSAFSPALCLHSVKYHFTSAFSGPILITYFIFKSNDLSCIEVSTQYTSTQYHLVQSNTRGLHKGLVLDSGQCPVLVL
jgi:hypothetical protein